MTQLFLYNCLSFQCYEGLKLLTNKMSKFLVNFFMLKTRIIVNTYTATTLPLYYAIQKPWKVLEEAKKLRTKKFETRDGELVWCRDETPVSHPSLLYNSYAEVLSNLTKDYDPNREVLGQRDVIRETVEKDENGIQKSCHLL